MYLIVTIMLRLNFLGHLYKDLIFHNILRHIHNSVHHAFNASGTHHLNHPEDCFRCFFYQITKIIYFCFFFLQPVPKYSETGEIVKGYVMNVSWSADHRVIDGALLARFSNLWRSYLESPELLILDLK